MGPITVQATVHLDRLLNSDVMPRVVNKIQEWEGGFSASEQLRALTSRNIWSAVGTGLFQNTLRTFRGFITSGKGNLATPPPPGDSIRSAATSRATRAGGVRVIPPGIMASPFTIWCFLWRWDMRCRRAGVGAQRLVSPSEKRWPSSWSGILSRLADVESLRGAPGDWRWKSVAWKKKCKKNEEKKKSLLAWKSPHTWHAVVRLKKKWKSVSVCVRHKKAKCVWHNYAAEWGQHLAAENVTLTFAFCRLPLSPFATRLRQTPASCFSAVGEGEVGGVAGLRNFPKKKQQEHFQNPADGVWGLLLANVI